MSQHGNAAQAAKTNARGERTNVAARRFTPKQTPLTEEQVRAADARARARTAKMDALAAKPLYDLTSREFLQLQNRYKTTERNPFTGSRAAGRAVTRHATSASEAETLHLYAILDHLAAGGTISPKVYESLPSASHDRMARDFPQQTRAIARDAATARLAKTARATKASAKGQPAARSAEAVTRHETASAQHAAARDARGTSIADAHTHEGLRAYHGRAADNERALAQPGLSATERRERMAELTMLNEQIPLLEARLTGGGKPAAAVTAQPATPRSTPKPATAASKPAPEAPKATAANTARLSELRQWLADAEKHTANMGYTRTAERWDDRMARVRRDIAKLERQQATASKATSKAIFNEMKGVINTRALNAALKTSVYRSDTSRVQRVVSEINGLVPSGRLGHEADRAAYALSWAVGTGRTSGAVAQWLRQANGTQILQLIADIHANVIAPHRGDMGGTGAYLNSRFTTTEGH
jgi:hypothetical protein